MKRVLLLAVLAGSAQAYAQESDTGMPAPQITAPETSRTAEQMVIPNLPTELTFAQLTKDWRRFTSRNTDSYAARMYGNSGPQYEQVLSDLGIGVHFTKGDHVTMGKETYLIAYRVDPGLDPQDLQQKIQQRLQALWGHGEQAPPPRPAGKFSPRATLKLSLLNLRNLGDFADLRSFDATSDLLRPTDLREMSNFNLRRLGQILGQYSRYQQLPLRDMNALRQMMRNQHAPVSLLREPATNETYHLNTALAGKKTDSIGNRKSVVMVYEAAPSSDNTRGVLFADGHVERVPEWKWAQVRAVKPKGPTPREIRVLSAARMKKLYSIMLGYSAEYELLPRFTNSQIARRKLTNISAYTPQMYQMPSSNKWYLFNTGISGVAPDNVSNRNQVVAVYEPESGSDGKRGAIFLDGVVRRIADNQWKTALTVKPKLKTTKTARAG